MKSAGSVKSPLCQQRIRVSLDRIYCAPSLMGMATSHRIHFNYPIAFLADVVIRFFYIEFTKHLLPRCFHL